MRENITILISCLGNFLFICEIEHLNCGELPEIEQNFLKMNSLYNLSLLIYINTQLNLPFSKFNSQVPI